MSTHRPTLATETALAVTAAATTLVAVLSWRGFTERPSTFLGPLLLLAVLTAGVGLAGRRARLGTLAVLGLQLLVTGMVASYVVCGSPIPVGAAWADLVTAFERAADGANTYAPPVPTSEADVDPLLVAGGLGCLLMVDLLACGVRSVPLAGLPLLTVYSVPVGLIGTDLTWWVFALSAVGFLLMLFAQENDQVSRWGRNLGEQTGSRVAGVGLGAGAVGLSATALAVVVPLAVPTLDVHLLDIGRGPGGGDGVDIANPIVDLRRDLTRGEDVPLLRVRTDDPDPSYLRTAVLTRFTENEWSSGDRQIPTDNRPDGRMPALAGVSAGVPRQTFEYDVDVLDTFESTWLPTYAPVTSVRAPGDWRYDVATMDFLATDEELTAAGLDYAMTGVELDLSAQELADAPSSAGMVSADYTDLPSGMPGIVRQLANQVTVDAPTRFQKAVALQDWFRENFEYSLQRVPEQVGNDELETFLGTGEGGRTGYCEQFAAAMAVMARQLGIPARVAVGFLSPTPVGEDLYEFSTYDLHAWPELFIAGSGWVRFEPTPPDRASGVPEYTQEAVGGPGDDPLTTPDGQGSEGLPDRNGEPEAGPEPEQLPEETQPEARDGADGSAVPWAGLAAGGLGALLVLALALLPRGVRSRRREARLAGGPEQVWAELRDTARDLGVPWADGRSPRQAGAALT